jgi:hypothetical protein
MKKDRFDNLTRRLVDRGGSRRTLLRMAGILMLPGLRAISAPAVRAVEVPDAQCPAPATISGYGRKRLTQTFKAQHTGRLTRTKVWAHSPSPSNTDDYLFEIRTTRNGKPSKTVLASAQVNDIQRSTFPQMTEVTIQFVPGAKVKKGERYALVVRGVGSASPSLQSNESPGCAGTLFDDGDLNNKFSKDANADIVFAAFVTKA